VLRPDNSGFIHAGSLTMPDASGRFLTGICFLLLLSGCTTGSQVHPTTLLKLAGFSQDMRERLSILGVRLFQTLHANIRLYMQIWDAETGTIAWEGSEEMSYAYDSSAELPVTFRRVVEDAALQLIQNLP
jgi:hypothetical protein